MAPKIDHLVLASTDLAELTKYFAGTTGVSPVAGGAHPAWGTHNALVSLGEAQYLELIAPQPGKTGSWARQFRNFHEPTLAGWCVRAANLARVADAAHAYGCRTRMMAGSRRTTDGIMLEWELLFLSHPELNPALPFFINWGDTLHPASTLEAEITLHSMEIATPGAEGLIELLAAISIEGVATTEQADTQLTAVLTGPQGTFSLEGVLPASFSLASEE